MPPYYMHTCATLSRMRDRQLTLVTRNLKPCLTCQRAIQLQGYHDPDIRRLTQVFTAARWLKE
ncbi:hypothetical protein CY34DRAFT_431407 [Suillus luteus UH-Slu-Lm8-n1]|uniref:Uncharacterized protein n=1 Tax=Suillus luteus UH-Slu-Lm8-n1 TaxID=930992 RepID=A0A0D0BHF1_9AGAM|nr:hypothetical protein CY34DRAFT_431407 [Suillus luteus UH-Slu-Lm8-n1]